MASDRRVTSDVDDLRSERPNLRLPLSKANRFQGILTVITRVVCWLYVLGIASAVGVVYSVTDQWWLATVFAFGPTWLALLPLTALVPIALMLRARLVPLMATVAVVYLFVVMGLCVPRPWEAASIGDHKPVKCLTCNVHGRAGGWGAVLRMINRESPDIVAFQEVGNGETELPEGWCSVREGQLVIASPFPITTTKKWIREDPPRRWPPLIAVYAVVEVPGHTLHICNVHLTSPHHGLNAVLDRNTIINLERGRKLKELINLRNLESQALSEWIETLPQVDVILGDFNMPIQSRIYQKWWSSYENSFSRAGSGFGYTRWADIRHVSFGVRVDHVLVGEDWSTLDCRVGPDVRSDHLPVLAEIVPRQRG